MQLCKNALLLDISLTFASLAFDFKGREMWDYPRSKVLCAFHIQNGSRL